MYYFSFWIFFLTIRQQCSYKNNLHIVKNFPVLLSKISTKIVFHNTIRFKLFIISISDDHSFIFLKCPHVFLIRFLAQILDNSASVGLIIFLHRFRTCFNLFYFLFIYFVFNFVSPFVSEMLTMESLYTAIWVIICLKNISRPGKRCDQDFISNAWSVAEKLNSILPSIPGQSHA